MSLEQALSSQWHPTTTEEANQALVDPWTATHLAWGVAFGAAGLGFAATMAIEVAWELWERWGREHHPEFFRDKVQDATMNSVMDLAAAAAGWAVGNKLRSL